MNIKRPHKTCFHANNKKNSKNNKASFRTFEQSSRSKKQQNNFQDCALPRICLRRKTSQRKIRRYYVGSYPSCLNLCQIQLRILRGQNIEQKGRLHAFLCLKVTREEYFHKALNAVLFSTYGVFPSSRILFIGEEMAQRSQNEPPQNI